MKGCKYCTDDTNDILHGRIALLNNAELGINVDVFITDEYELELFGDCEDKIVIKAKTPIAYCPFCGRELRVNESDKLGIKIGHLNEDMIARIKNAIDKHVPTIIEADKEVKTDDSVNTNTDLYILTATDTNADGYSHTEIVGVYDTEAKAKFRHQVSVGAWEKVKDQPGYRTVTLSWDIKKVKLNKTDPFYRTFNYKDGMDVRFVNY